MRLVFGISELGNTGHFTTIVEVGLGIGSALVGKFVFHSLRSRSPLLNLRPWSNRSLAAANATIFLYGAAINAVLFLVQLYYQLARGASPLRSALLVAPRPSEQCSSSHAPGASWTNEGRGRS
jgi:hypothetical protein